jgi:hypothetical protein
MNKFLYNETIVKHLINLNQMNLIVVQEETNQQSKQHSTNENYENDHKKTTKNKNKRTTKMKR